MRYKAIFGCACLGWILGWMVAPRIAFEFFPPTTRLKTLSSLTNDAAHPLPGKFRSVPTTTTITYYPTGHSVIETFTPLLGAIVGGVTEIVWHRRNRKPGKVASSIPFQSEPSRHDVR